MPPLPIPGQPSTSPPQAGAGTVPGQPPFGSSPITMPTPNRGEEAQATALVKSAYDMLAKALPGLGFGTEPSERVRKAMDLLAKIAPPGSVAPGAQNTAQQNFLMQQRQQQPLLAMLAQHGQAQPGAQPPPAAGG